MTRLAAMLLLPLAGALLLVPAACGDPEPKRPNVLLISIDTCRADRLGCYGHPVAETPNMDGLARDDLDLRVIRQANAGPAAARNAGLARVDSGYVLVLDADERLTRGGAKVLRAVARRS